MTTYAKTYNKIINPEFDTQLNKTLDYIKDGINLNNDNNSNNSDLVGLMNGNGFIKPINEVVGNINENGFIPSGDDELLFPNDTYKGDKTVSLVCDTTNDDVYLCFNDIKINNYIFNSSENRYDNNVYLDILDSLNGKSFLIFTEVYENITKSETVYTNENGLSVPKVTYNREWQFAFSRQDYGDDEELMMLILLDQYGAWDPMYLHQLELRKTGYDTVLYTLSDEDLEIYKNQDMVSGDIRQTYKICLGVYKIVKDGNDKWNVIHKVIAGMNRVFDGKRNSSYLNLDTIDVFEDINDIINNPIEMITIEEKKELKIENNKTIRKTGDEFTNDYISTQQIGDEYISYYGDELIYDYIGYGSGEEFPKSYKITDFTKNNSNIKTYTDINNNYSNITNILLVRMGSTAVSGSMEYMNNIYTSGNPNLNIGDLVLYYINGSTYTAHSLIRNDNFGGSIYNLSGTGNSLSNMVSNITINNIFTTNFNINFTSENVRIPIPLINIYNLRNNLLDIKEIKTDKITVYDIYTKEKKEYNIAPDKWIYNKENKKCGALGSYILTEEADDYYDKILLWDSQDWNRPENTTLRYLNNVENTNKKDNIEIQNIRCNNISLGKTILKNDSDIYLSKIGLVSSYTGTASFESVFNIQGEYKILLNEYSPYAWVFTPESDFDIIIKSINDTIIKDKYKIIFNRTIKITDEVFIKYNNELGLDLLLEINFNDEMMYIYGNKNYNYNAGLDINVTYYGFPASEGISTIEERNYITTNNLQRLQKIIDQNNYNTTTAVKTLTAQKGTIVFGLYKKAYSYPYDAYLPLDSYISGSNIHQAYIAGVSSILGQGITPPIIEVGARCLDSVNYATTYTGQWKPLHIIKVLPDSSSSLFYFGFFIRVA